MKRVLTNTMREEEYRSWSISHGQEDIMKQKARHFTAACLIISIAVSAAACGQSGTAKSEQVTEAGVFTAETLYPEMILTKEEMLSDYDAMWKAVKENYPFFGVLYRNNPEHPDYYDEVIGDYRRQIINMQQEGDCLLYTSPSPRD